MTNVSIYLIIILAVAVLAVIIGIVLYNRRLDKITSGEERDIHSSIPEPSTTVSTAYKVVLMILVIISFLTVSSLKNEITSLRSTINNLQSSQNQLYQEIYQLRSKMEEDAKNVSFSDWKIKNPNLSEHTAELSFSAALKNYTDDIKVSLNVTRNETYTDVFPLEKISEGKYGGTITVGLFDMYENALLTMDQDGSITTEPIDFPTFCFHDFFPIPQMSSHFGSGMKGGKLTYDGAFIIMSDHLDKIDKVTLTYLVDGKELKTLDVTKEVFNETEMTLEQGLSINNSLSLQTDVFTKDGYRISYNTLCFYSSTSNIIEDGFERIYGPDGDLLWENPKYY